MAPIFSFYLNVLRVCAAVAVLLYHSGQIPSFSRGQLANVFGMEQGHRAHLAVIVFFVLSGYLIGTAATKPQITFRIFVEHRIARLWSVVLPGLLLAGISMGFLFFLDPSTYNSLSVNGYQLIRYVICSVFLNQIWLLCTHPGTISPIWSIGYEFWYYMLAGVIVFKSGRQRILLLGVIFLVIGPKIMLLAPAWFFGFLAHRYRAELLEFTSQALISIILLTACAIIYCLIQAPNILFWSDTIGQYPLYFSSNFAVDNAFALAIATHLVALRTVLDRRKQWEPPRLLNSGFKLGADISFSVYLYHYPLFYIIGSTGVIGGFLLRHDIARVTIVLVIISIFAHFTELRLVWWRSQISALGDNVFNRSSTPTVTRS